MPSRFLKASCVLLCAVAALPATVQAKSLYGTFTEVLSGDLLVFQHDAGSYTVRIYGIDTPDAGEPFALEAKLLTRALVMGGSEQRVRIKVRNERDEMLAMVLVDGQDVGLALLRAGLAKRVPDEHYKLTSNDQPDALVAAEDEARLALRGVWKGAPPAADGKAAIEPEADKAVRGGGTTTATPARRAAPTTSARSPRTRPTPTSCSPPATPRRPGCSPPQHRRRRHLDLSGPDGQDHRRRRRRPGRHRLL